MTYHSTTCSATQVKRLRKRTMICVHLILTCGLLACAAVAYSAPPPTDGDALRAELRHHYPSLAWVDRYRKAYPEEAQGSAALWHGANPPALDSNDALIDALAALQDQHVALSGPQVGKQESLGVLFRTSSDGDIAVWRHVDQAVTSVSDGEQVIEIDGQPAARWLEHAAARTFGGNRRSRAAEAALKFAVATSTEHAAVGLTGKVHLLVRGADGVQRAVELDYRPVTAPFAGALAHAVEQSDLPELVQTLGYRIGIVRLGAFAPQYDPDFDAAADNAERTGAKGDAPMLAGLCAIVRKRLRRIDELAQSSDLLVIDLRGNLGGFAREARLLARALTPQPLPRTLDVFPGSSPGRLKLVEQADDPSCGTIATPRPLVVWTDAGTRSSGEFVATWLWAAGAIVVGERTVGAGGGRDADSIGFVLPRSGVRVKYSGNFSVFDNGTEARPGETSEATLIERIAKERFAPSRTSLFAIQAVGLRPDLILQTSADDLSDGGAAALRRMVGMLMQRKLLSPPSL